MTETRSSFFGRATFVSTSSTLLFLAVTSGLPFGRLDPTPGWVWALIGASLLTCLALLAVDGIARRIAAGVLIAVVTPIILLLTALIVALIGKAFGSIVG